MNYKLELNTQEAGSNIIFNNIIFGFFKVNIIERHAISKSSKSSLKDVIFKIRTLDDTIIKTKEDNGRVKLKGDNLESYKKLSKVLNSYEYKRKLINRKNAEQLYVDFILRLVVSNYTLN